MPQESMSNGGTAAAGPPARSWLRGTRRWLLVGGAVVVVAASLVTFATLAVRDEAELEPEPDAAPVRTVREFLAALAQKDPQRALEIAGVAEPPTGEPAQFLRPEAMSDEWTVRTVAQVDAYDRPGEATVRATIAGPDEDTVDLTVRLTETDGSWVINDPFARVAFVSGPLWYLEVNDYRTPADVYVGDQDYLLLPGFYRFYPDLPPGVEAEFEAKLLVPGSATVVTPLDLRVTDAGEAAIQRAVEAYVDMCATSTELVPHACPFGSTLYSRLPGYSLHWEYGAEVQWTVLGYPVVAAAPHGGSLAIADRQRGLIRLRGQVRAVEVYNEPDVPVDGYPEPGSVVSVVCEIDSDKLAAGFTMDGAVEIAASYDRQAFPDPPAPMGRIETETCTYVSLAAT